MFLKSICIALALSSLSMMILPESEKSSPFSSIVRSTFLIFASVSSGIPSPKDESGSEMKTPARDDCIANASERGIFSSGDTKIESYSDS